LSNDAAPPLTQVNVMLFKLGTPKTGKQVMCHKHLKNVQRKENQRLPKKVA